jgi:hypothetical protein
MATKEQIIAGTLQVIAMFNFKVTLRQVFYRLVEDLRILEKTNNEYKRLSKVLVEARLAGLVPIDAFADLGRSLVGENWWNVFSTPEEHYEQFRHYFKEAAQYYRVPRWHEQAHYVEVWVEKAAMQSFFGQVTNELHVPLFPTRGYPSLTSLKEAADRLQAESDGKKVTILYYGDFDPSGVEITEYVRKRLLSDFGVDAEVERIAINGDHIEEFSLPTAPPKQSDSRTARFEQEHGPATVELEAFRPDDLTRLVRDAIERYFDDDVHRRTQRAQADGRREVQGRVDEAFESMEE